MITRDQRRGQPVGMKHSPDTDKGAMSCLESDFVKPEFAERKAKVDRVLVQRVKVEQRRIVLRRVVRIFARRVQNCPQDYVNEEDESHHDLKHDLHDNKRVQEPWRERDRVMLRILVVARCPATEDSMGQITREKSMATSNRGTHRAYRW